MRTRDFLVAASLVVTLSCVSGSDDIFGSEKDDEVARTSASRAALEGDGTIPRVPNPPLASDLASLPGDLRGVPVPGPGATALGRFVRDARYALVLGKALFWDMQVGSDGIQACASCHFRAGADPRSKNQLSPGLNRFPGADLSFAKGGPNYQLTAADFPLSRLAIPGTRGALDSSTDNNDTVSSQGVHHLTLGQADPFGFRVANANTRRVEPRNTPSVINAVFNHRQFWDGRAENVFNGTNHVGTRDPSAFVLESPKRQDDPVPRTVRLLDSSLASQAVAPIVNTLEMAAPGTTPQDVAAALTRKSRQLGKRVSPVRPLAKQRVLKTDSVLADWARDPSPGLSIDSYDTLIALAFKREWWDSKKMVRVHPGGAVSFVDPGQANDGDPSTDEYTLLQYNFALFFGIAVQMYEATLVSDDTPWDRFRRAHPTASDPALNPWTNVSPAHISRLALFGAMLFNDRTRGATNIRCSNCHEQAELTDASARRINAAANGPVRNRDGNVIDKGFNNIGVRPTADDLGVGASDVLGELSHTRRLFPGAPPATFEGTAVTQGFGVDGAFKIPSLRNVALTAPYFHNGDARTLRQVMELYGRGGNVAPILARAGNTIEPLGVPNLTNDEMEALVAFLESLTDDRVLHRRAPFDHPQLFVPNGHPGNHTSTVDANGDGLADDLFFEVPAVGAAGGTAIPGFLEGAFAPQ